MQSYAATKAAARAHIMDILDEMHNAARSYGELCEMQQHIYRIAKRYGFLRELRDNGII